VTKRRTKNVHVRADVLPGALVGLLVARDEARRAEAALRNGVGT